VGCIKNVIESGPQLILVVENVGGVEILLPYTESLLIKLDREAKEMHINIADGLIDVYTNPENED
jgi:16S rRNA processing protein RimM